jgi:hypothetical protein
MDPFHLALINYSIGATLMVCLECHYVGVDIMCYQMALLEKLSNL